MIAMISQVKFIPFVLVGLVMLSFSSVLAQATDEETPPVECLAAPDELNLAQAFDVELQKWLVESQASYADTYTNLSYSVARVATIEDDTGYIEATYTGSVTDVSTGESISASGPIHASFSWNGCFWQLIDYSY